MEQMNQICRLCLTASQDATSSINDAEMISQLKVIFKFEFDYDETLPQAICTRCSSKVDEFHIFHESVLANQALLKTDTYEKKLFVSVEAERCPSANECKEAGFSEEEDHLLMTEIKTELNEEIDEPVDETENQPDSSEEDTIESNNSDDTTLRSTKRWRKSISKVLVEKDLGEKDLKIKNFFGTIKCGSCTETFETLNKLKRHSSKAHGTKGAISCCDRSFEKKSKLLEHIDTHFDASLLHCKICDKHYKTKASYEIHYQKKHCGTDQNPFGCDQCKQRFPKEFMLTAHLKKHIKVQCTICSRVMANFQSLKAHMQLMHEEVKPVKPEHICDICGKIFHLKHDLKKHTNRHQGIVEERVQCSVCNKWLATKNSLKVHMQTHAENERVACEICNQTVLKHVLSSHKRKVHGEKKFACNICGKTFLLSRYLKEHQAAHEGKQMYSCTFCGHMTNYSTNLHTHVKTKHPEEWAAARARGENMVASAEVDASVI